ncbi:protein S100-A10 [Rhinatrema bivittatum]|uniref:protein S100-A10 n=1 Tax=Rhinatrema bivittatum TaxID=194408 RepID=UPI00112E125A|nr:protein S100-A10 [Rhinatrema bivittatum]
MVVPTAMEQAMQDIMFIFHEHAGEKGYMNKEDMKRMMDKHFSEFIKNQKDPLAVDKIMKDLDQCRDGRVNFHSYFSLIAGLTSACNEYYVSHMKQKPRKH